ncbi:MAG: 2,4-dihydroxyhept-2-ene-1,7-dioic acid aldolase [Candidatus Omnitrophica bacterium]|nr:2,4-dihydroxyhept-2-ene-1,7-dioic acid aldolase [Candidatus Omnitrophota bacterium]
MNLKEKLKNGQVSIGSWLTIGDASVAEIMSKSGFDWLAVDMEHSAITLKEAQDLIRIIELCGVVPLVRVGENNPNLIKRVMDAGAHGVIVPMVNSKDDAIKAFNSTKYPPLGKRGVGLARAQNYGLGFERYKKWVNKGSIVIVQIEHIEAVENLEEIFSVDGLDGFIIGPYDLSASLGTPGDFKNSKFVRAINRIKEVAKKYEIPAGLHVIDPSAVKLNHSIKEGYKFIGFSLDALLLGTKCKQEMEAINYK